MFDQTLERFRVSGVVTGLLMVLLLLLGACSEDGSGVTLPDGATLPEISAPEVTAPETTAPETTAPAPEAAPEPEDDGSTVPLWVVVVLGMIIIGFIAYFAARSGSKRQAQPVPAPVPPAPAPPAPAPPAVPPVPADPAQGAGDQQDTEGV
jgi:hypothetical protein